MTLPQGEGRPRPRGRPRAGRGPCARSRGPTCRSRSTPTAAGTSTTARHGARAAAAVRTCCSPSSRSPRATPRRWPYLRHVGGSRSWPTRASSRWPTPGTCSTAHAADVISVYPGKNGGIAASIEIAARRQGGRASPATSAATSSWGSARRRCCTSPAPCRPSTAQTYPADILGPHYHEADLLAEPLALHPDGARVPDGPGLGRRARRGAAHAIPGRSLTNRGALPGMFRSAPRCPGHPEIEIGKLIPICIQAARRGLLPPPMSTPTANRG